MSDISDAINRVLSAHGSGDLIDALDVVATKHIVTGAPNGLDNLTRIVSAVAFPSVSEAEVYHYTSKNAAVNILSKNSFRLTNILKRFDEGEIEGLCKACQFDGYLKQAADGTPFYKTSLMPDLFYASFTGTSLSPSDEDYFLREFGQGNPVRLKLRIHSERRDFRRIVYGDPSKKPISLLTDLIAEIRDKFGLRFILPEISRLVAFFLSHDYEHEAEYRILHKTTPDLEPTPIGAGEDSYIELPIGGSSVLGYTIDVIEVCAESSADIPKQCGSFGGVTAGRSSASAPQRALLQTKAERCAVLLRCPSRSSVHS